MSRTILGDQGSHGPLGTPGFAGTVYMDDLSQKLYISDGSGSIGYPVDSIQNIEQMDQYRRKRELLDAENKERIEALKTIFPRGYEAIGDFNDMLDIAGDDQLNPLYEEVLKNFEEAQAALHRAARKLATAVKMTDSEKLSEIRQKRAMEEMSSLSGAWRNTYFTGINRPTGSGRISTYNPPHSIMPQPTTAAAPAPPPPPPPQTYSSATWTGVQNNPQTIADSSKSCLDYFKSVLGIK